VERQMKWWVDNGFMKRTLPLDKIVDTTFLEDALKQVGP
jgi:ABC-type nitrate/sulfonate/bicarbonate transport system substrate-binding protein